MLDVILRSKNMTLYELEKKSGVAHSTLNDIYHEKCDINKCSIATLSKIAKSLNINIDKLYSVLNYDDLSYFKVDSDFDLFKSNVCHEVKRITPEKFIKKYLNNKEIEMLYKSKKYAKSLYLLSMLDYLCLENNKPINKDFESIRKKKLDKVIIQDSIALLLQTKRVRYSEIMKDSIPVFYKHNIVEGDIHNVM